jgi:hypothetical protein
MRKNMAIHSRLKNVQAFDFTGKYRPFDELITELNRIKSEEKSIKDNKGQSISDAPVYDVMSVVDDLKSDNLELRIGAAKILGKLKAKAAGQPIQKCVGLEAEGTFENGNKHTYAYGAAAAHVAVDPGTGQVEVLEYVSVEDVGRVVNPLTATGQAVGAVVQGLGGCFLERLQYDAEGQFLSGSLADYLLPTSTDFPRIRAFVTGTSPAPSTASITAVSCGTPTPVTTRVVQMEPGPTPTFTASTPRSTNAAAPARVATLPATSCTSGNASRTFAVASSTPTLCPCAVSITSTSTPACTSARARSR